MKKSEDMSSCFDTIHKRGRHPDRRMDGQTWHQTEQQNLWCLKKFTTNMQRKISEFSKLHVILCQLHILHIIHFVKINQ